MFQPMGIMMIGGKNHNNEKRYGFLLVKLIENEQSKAKIINN